MPDEYDHDRDGCIDLDPITPTGLCAICGPTAGTDQEHT